MEINVKANTEILKFSTENKQTHEDIPHCIGDSGQQDNNYSSSKEKQKGHSNKTIKKAAKKSSNIQLQTKKMKEIINRKNSKKEEELVTITEQAVQQLQILKNIARDPLNQEETEQHDLNIKNIEKYIDEENLTIFPEEIYNLQEFVGLTPSIFLKKNILLKQYKPASAQLIAFENYLQIVSQMYYKGSINLSDQILTSDHLKDNSKLLNEPVVKLKQGPGRKSKQNLRILQSQFDENYMNHDQSNNVPNIEEKEEKSKNLLLTANHDILDCLISPIRTNLVYEKWSPKEIAIFETGICKFGKQFSYISYLIGSKKLIEVTEFYQSWKQTSHYKLWKHYKNTALKANLNYWIQIIYSYFLYM